MVPIGNAYPFLMLMGTVSMAWLLFWQAGIADEKLGAIYREKGIDTSKTKEVKIFLKEHREAAFYHGKLLGAEYYIFHVLPDIEARAKSIKSGNLAFMDIIDDGFASV